MRQQFAKLVHTAMEKNKNLFFLTGDLGMFVLDDLKKDYPSRFINCGAAEQAMLDIAVGLTYSGKNVICYSISPFILYRPFETIRTYINHENLPILLVGSGRDDDYKHDGFSHYAGDDWKLFEEGEGLGDSEGILYKVQGYWPESEKQLADTLGSLLTFKRPAYLNLKK